MSERSAEAGRGAEAAIHQHQRVLGAGEGHVGQAPALGLLAGARLGLGGPQRRPWPGAASARESRPRRVVPHHQRGRRVAVGDEAEPARGRRAARR